ncbi:sacsin N-terminal ATP-binding-like domain-containing protein, partial [Angustibacter aerolatus]
MSDPFGVARVRERVLASWAAAPVRLREDANAEQDLALGGYRDRLVVELAQNAADAAARAGVPGVLQLTLHDDVLVAANTGAPLDAAGVESLATLRASAKRDAGGEQVGRFGVGFAAVLAVTDEPVVLSRSGGVRFSRDDTAAVVAEVAADRPELAAEVRRRGGHVPVLRLPFEAEGAPPSGFDTAVVLPLRDALAVDVVHEQLARLDDAVLLALPALAEVRVDDGSGVRVLREATSRWRVVRRSGRWTPGELAGLLADRPVEEQSATGWSVLWALPHDGAAPAVVHAPTPTDERSSLPALLLASLPLDPSRRHVQPGPLADRVLELAADPAAARRVEVAADGGDALPLVPVA